MLQRAINEALYHEAESKILASTVRLVKQENEGLKEEVRKLKEAKDA